jgi:mono/diheme cytochrome c family protein
MLKPLAFTGVLSAIAMTAMVPHAAQRTERVDFGRDVQPLFRDHCYSCHGPDQQMNGFRLDRRADALRGGGQTNIGPGNADGSRMYHRLIGTKFGAQMPPTGPLSSDQIATIKAWIDQGAEWPDQFAGEPPTFPVDPEAARLIEFIRAGDRDSADRIIRRSSNAARSRGPGGSTALMFAALYGDVALMRQLLAAGADPNAANAAGATALIWAVPDVDRLRLLLDAGADVNAHSEEKRTALVIAAGIVGAAPAVNLLLEYAAAAWEPLAGSNPGPLREAARVDSADAFRLLLAYGADRRTVTEVFLRTNCIECARAMGQSGSGPLARVPPPDLGLRPVFSEGPPAAAARAAGASAATAATIRAAVDRSLPMLQRIDIPFIKKTGCVSCHHNTVVSMAVDAATRNGYRINEPLVAEQRRIIAGYLESWRERTLQNIPIAGGVDTVSYLLLGTRAAGQSPDQATDAQAIWLRRRQQPDGHWAVQTIRPPIESNDIEVTAVSMRALQMYAPQTQRQEFQRAIDKARDWLEQATANATEEHAFRVLGLSWARARNALIAAAARELLAVQQVDGGWAQLPAMTSDAYATGEALVALQHAGIGMDAPAFRRGVEFLLRTQLDDGSWYVQSRAMPIQAYFESGFPHRADQWISAAATAWATTALASIAR